MDKLEIKVTKSISYKVKDGVAALKKVLEHVPDNATASFDTSWLGQGYSERQEATGITWTWTETI